MFAKLQDANGDVCVNMDTGLRIRPVITHGLPAGLKIIFPDGNTHIEIRGEYDKLTAALGAVDAR